MSNYTVTTNFAAKDLLTSGNPLKVILGSQFTTEFNAIAAAIASKLDAAGDISARGIALCRFKPAATSRTSTTTPTLDPDLQIVLPTGTYEYEIVGEFDAGASGTNPGIQVGVTFSGSDSSNNADEFILGGSAVSAGPPVNTIFNAPGSLPSTQNNFVYKGSFSATTGGTFGLSWAQKTSSTTALILNSLAYMKITQLS
jgi:hypothetical protein